MPDIAARVSIETSEFENIRTKRHEQTADEREFAAGVILRRSDEIDPVTAAVKPKRRSMWKRAKRVRRLFCCARYKYLKKRTLLKRASPNRVAAVRKLVVKKSFT